jgi:hypothetical protein
MLRKLRDFVGEAGIVMTIFTAVPLLTIAYITVVQAWIAISSWPPISERLAALH